MNDKRYFVVDKETGEVVGETDLDRKRRHPVRLFLSWLVLPACATAFYYLADLYLQLVFWGIRALAGESPALRIIVYVLAGSTVICVLFYGVLIGASATALASMKLHASARGTRFVVFGTVWSVWYALMIITLAVGISRTDTPAFSYLLCGTMIAYLVITAIVGKEDVTKENVKK